MGGESISWKKKHANNKLKEMPHSELTYQHVGGDTVRRVSFVEIIIAVKKVESRNALNSYESQNQC